MTMFYGSGGQRFRYKRLNYGSISSQDIFDKAMDDTIRGIDGIVHTRDDFIVHGKTQEAHDEAVEKFLDRMKDSNLSLNPQKAKIGVKVKILRGWSESH